MAATRPTTPTLAQLTDLAAQLRRDEANDQSTLRKRDRDIGRELDKYAVTDRSARIVAWLDRVWPKGEARPGDKAIHVDTAAHVIAIIFGVVLGVSASAALLFYDGSRPVNVFHVLGLFVGVQWLLIALTSVACLPRRWAVALSISAPLIGLQNLITSLSPGRLQSFAARWFSDEQRDAWRQALAAGRVHHQLFSDVHRWLVLDTAQWLAVAFNVGAIATTLLTIVLQDVAFVWSTTLRIDAPTFHQITQVLAMPWAWLWPQASPSIELVEVSRYFRFGEGSVTADAETLGQWWPFVVACMVVWGLLPRLVLFGVARRGRRRAIAATFHQLPGLDQLEDRLNAALVETRAVEPELSAAGWDDSAPPGSPSDASPAAGTAIVINWSGVPVVEEMIGSLIRQQIGAKTEAFHVAGGEQDPANDDHLIDRIANLSTTSRVVVLVKSWEPPMGELVDFLANLRSAIGKGRTITVLPVGVDIAGSLQAPDAEDRAIWSRSLAQLADPWLKMADWREEAAP
jgi:hypothetical protein